MTFSETPGTFDGLGISPRLIEILDKLHFKIPTPIQNKAIPPGIEGKDLIGIAQTGTGKTLAFVLPMIQHLSQKKGKGLILVPTRELAAQVDETCQKVSPVFGIKTALLIGGASMGMQIQNLRRNPRIIIATPGRLSDHLNQRTIMLGDVSILVLDEADRMLDMGFQPQIEHILQYVPKDRQTLLFSATMPEPIAKIAATHMKLPVRVEIARSGTLVEQISQELFIVKHENKKDLLKKILTQYRGSVLIFSRTKIGAQKRWREVRAMGERVAEIHSDRSLAQRREALEGFKTGKYRVLIATDIAARGIDVTGIELVINYDLPDDAENYVHRIGRTGRAGHTGHAISFATPDQEGEVRSIEKLVRVALPVAEHPELPPEKFDSFASTPSRRPFGSSGGHRPGGGGGGHKRRSFGARTFGKPRRSR